MFVQDNFIENQKNNTLYVSLGNYCLTLMLLKENNLKYESYPFDWMVSCIENIIDIFSDDFTNFLDKNNYINIHNKTLNKFYFEKTNKLFNNIKIDHQHHNLLNDNDYNYLTRCVDRIRNIYNQYNNVIFIMIQPLYISNKINDYEIINKLYTTLKKYYNKNFKLLIFNITKIDNDLYKETKLNDETYVYELKTKMIKGNYGMMYFDNDGVKKFIEILKSFK